MLRQSALLMVLTAAMAASFSLSDVATAAAAEKDSKSTEAKAVRAWKQPGRRDGTPQRFLRGRSDRRRFSGSPSRAKGPRGLDAASARELWRRRSSRRDLPAELQEGFEAWLRESLVEELARSLGKPAVGPSWPRELRMMGLAPAGDARWAGPTSAVPGFSTTNLQEAGVDESDSIKFDGEFLYIAPVGFQRARGEEESEPVVAIRVLRATDDPAQAEEIGEIEIPGISAVVGMYLLGNAEEGVVRLLVVGSTRQRSGLEIPWTKPWDWGGSRTTLHLFDVSDPAEAREQWSLVIEGQLVSTRRVEERLHIVTRATPVYQLVAPLSDTEDALLQAREMVMQESEAELLPRVVVDGRAPEPLVPLRRCFLPVANANEISGIPVLLTITSLDLRRPKRRVSVCMGGMAGDLYSSTQSLYLTARSAGITVIHKFAYTDRGPQYRGVGRVEGFLAGAERGFSLGEHDGVLGVVTDNFGRNSRIGAPLPLPISIAPPGGIFLPSPLITFPAVPIRITGPTVKSVPDEDQPEEPDLGRYRLTLLRESREEDFVLDEVSHIPNAEQPEPIGKPGDFIHGVRFMGERLYVVTYRKVDPLYAIDLSDPETPRIAGQLQVPGFSDYLHPIGSDLLLGVGFDTLSDVRNDWFQGIKVELFDVSDPTALESLDVIAVGRRGSQSAALRDHHVISHLPAGPDGLHRFAVPIQVHDREPRFDDRPMTRFPWLHTGLYLFEVEEASSAAAQLREVGAVIAAEAGEGATSSGQYTGGDRSVIQGAAVHYVHGRQVWSAPWDAPEEAVGPQ